MSWKRLLRLAAFDLGIACLFVILLARPFLGRFLGSLLYAVPAVTVAAAAAAACLYVNWKAIVRGLFGRAPGTDTPGGCIEAIEEYISTNIRTFRPDLNDMIDQLEKLQRKREAIRQALLDRFQPGELAFAKFSAASDRAEAYLLRNARDVLARVKGFDEEEYEDVMNSPGTSREEFQARKRIYDDVLADVSEKVSQGEKVLIALDKLLAAVATISTFDQQQSDSDSAVSEIDGLVKDVQFYRGAIGN
ncbi:MAG: hypothetical protein LBG06_08945 [Deltaproteobacteria bacterium]|jgi:ABC-type transporter Mla subunit MlaD|nr:hypothetical protein [Deltaproteobacteria bacterium]